MTGEAKACNLSAQKDFYGTCASIKWPIQSKRLNMSCLMQSGFVSEESQTQLQGEVTHLQTWLETHEDHVTKSHKHYSELLQHRKKEWEAIKRLEGRDRMDEEQKFATLQHSFTLNECWLPSVKACPILGLISSTWKHLLSPEVVTRHTWDCRPSQGQSKHLHF